MKLAQPFEISSRLMPALRIGDAWISLNIGRETSEGRFAYDVWIDLPDGSEHHIDDMRSGVGSASVQDGFSSLLSFLSAAAESRAYRERHLRQESPDPDSNESLFPTAIVDWADSVSDELSMLSLDLETPDLIQE